MACSPLSITVAPRPVVPDEARISSLASLLADIAEPATEGPTVEATDLPSELLVALATWSARGRLDG